MGPTPCLLRSRRLLIDELHAFDAGQVCAGHVCRSRIDHARFVQCAGHVGNGSRSNRSVEVLPGFARPPFEAADGQRPGGVGERSESAAGPGHDSVQPDLQIVQCARRVGGRVRHVPLAGTDPVPADDVHGFAVAVPDAQRDLSLSGQEQLIAEVGSRIGLAQQHRVTDGFRPEPHRQIQRCQPVFAVVMAGQRRLVRNPQIGAAVVRRVAVAELNALPERQPGGIPGGGRRNSGDFVRDREPGRSRELPRRTAERAEPQGVQDQKNKGNGFTENFHNSVPFAGNYQK